jgi:regulator of cell morphogenesis and NO signaling
MQDLISTSVGELVAERESRSRLFQSLGIDFCCGGDKTLAKSCADLGLQVEEVVDQLREEGQQSQVFAPRCDEMSLSGLIEHIEVVHHQFLRTELPRLQELMHKVVSAHRSRHAFVVPLNRALATLARDIEPHMFKEEQVLFPMIRSLEEATERPEFHCGSLANPVGVMEYEHETVGSCLKEMRELTSDYRVPADACPTFQALLAGLEDLERDLQVHIHKENNILHPRALELERSFS